MESYSLNKLFSAMSLIQTRVTMEDVISFVQSKDHTEQKRLNFVYQLDSVPH